MNHTSAHQALVAGLGSASMVLMPHAAHAMTLDEFATGLLGLPFAPFAIGVIGGAAVAGGVYGIAVKVAQMSENRHPKKSFQPVRAAHLSQTPVAASIYKPRHMSPADFERSGVIRVIPAQAYEPPAAPATQKHLKQNIIDRIGDAMMDGVPVIERADGTVGDVGTSWWKHGVGSRSIISGAGFSGGESVDAGQHDKDWIALQNITHRVAQIDEGLYPEKRTSDDLDKSDAWTSALEALDEQLGNSGKVAYVSTFIDTVGGSETLEEPDVIEYNSGFIPYAAPSARSEAADTNSFIKHLASGEAQRNGGPASSRGSRHFLRVIEGGTNNLRTKDVVQHGRSGEAAYVGRHFAPMAVAAQG